MADAYQLETTSDRYLLEDGSGVYSLEQDAPITGTGSLAAQSAALAASGLSLSTGTGALASAAATESGSGVSLSTGTGALVSASAALSAAGVSRSSGTGALADGSAALSGSGLSSSTGTGALASSATLAASGVSSSSGSGTPASPPATLAGFGNASFGTPLVTRGYLFSRELLVTGGYGTPPVEEISGTGSLVSQSASLSAEGSVSGGEAPPVTDFGAPPWRVPKKRLPVIVGRGRLRAGPATIRGYGDVNWDDQNEDALMLVLAEMS